MSAPWQERVEIGDATLYLGDCRDVLPTLGQVDAVVTDPPYGVGFKGKVTKHTPASEGYLSGDTEIGPEVVRSALITVKRAVVFPGIRLMYRYPEPYDIGCVYWPSGAGLGRWGWVVMHPMLFYGTGLPHSRQGPSGFQSFDVVDDCGHPCPKPVRWMEWAVAKATGQGEAVLDPFMGSATTGVACARLGRRFIGIEIEPRYFEIAIRRVEDAQRQGRLFDAPKPKAEQISMFGRAS